jgi:predicted small lipoprotein YifL
MKRDPAGLIFAACTALVLGACGQKGPLFLPGDPSEIQTEIPAEPETPEIPDDGDGDADGDADNEPDGDADDIDR